MAAVADIKECRSRFAWTTVDRDSGVKYHRYKTIRMDDGVVVGEHLEIESGSFWAAHASRGIRKLWGLCDTDRKYREDMQVWGITVHLKGGNES